MLGKLAALAKIRDPRARLRRPTHAISALRAVATTSLTGGDSSDLDKWVKALTPSAATLPWVDERRCP
jgi:hypothetical protein